MNKDVIYIDVEDDITAIIGKIKSSKQKIIALVPPKRVGVLQSAVNMRLLTRTAEAAGKRVVLITGDHILAGLAAAAHIPVAKNLQSKPEMAQVPALKVDDQDDIIDGRQLPVGVLAGKAQPSSGDAAVAAVRADEAGSTDKAKAKPVAPATKAKPGGPKVPNFNLFRKKLLLIGGGITVLVVFLVWALWFAPHATVVISAKTTTVTVDKTITLKLDATTDAKANLVKALRQEQKKDISVEFTPTGKKRVGEKATGRVRLKVDGSRLVEYQGITVPAGTQVKAPGGQIFITTSAAAFAVTDSSSFRNGVMVSVVAQDIGEEYNGATGRGSTSAAGVNFVSFDTPTSGGSSRQITVVSREDIAKATDRLNELKDDELRNKLTGQFGSSALVVQESYAEQRSTPSPSVAVDAEAGGAVSLKATLTATMLAIDKADINAFLTDSVNEEIKGKKSQKIYSDGAGAVKFTQFMDKQPAPTIRLTANAVVGPTIDERQVKEQAKGKNYGDIQSSLESIDGVETVDTKFWPFWVRTVPGDIKRIDVKFEVKNASS